MTTPVVALLGFAVWTLIFLLTSVGVYRWKRILTGHASLTDFPADGSGGQDWYRRATRAHSNCIENLPVFGAIVLALEATGISNPLINILCLAILAARVLQSVTHVAFKETKLTVAFRFSFFVTQVLAMLLIAGLITKECM